MEISSSKLNASFSGFFDLGTIFNFSNIFDLSIDRVATEDKYGSNVNMEPDSPTDEDKKAKQDEGKNNFLPVLITTCLSSYTYQFIVISMYGRDSLITRNKMHRLV